MVSEVLRERVREILGDTVSVAPVSGGYTQAARFVARCEDGRSVFVKAATTSETAEWLAVEHHVLSALQSRFMPRVIAWDPTEMPLLVLEDLSSCQWPPPWPADGATRLLDTLVDVHAVRPPEQMGLPSLEAQRPLLNGWNAVATDPRPFLSLGWCDERWLDDCLGDLRRAADTAPLAGDALVHADVRSDNVCFCSDRVVIVDWNLAHTGNPHFDVAAWLPSLALEGGPQPEEVLGGHGELAALVAGFFAGRAGLSPPWPGSTVRRFQFDQLRVALPWACAELRLRPPPSSDGMRR